MRVFAASAEGVHVARARHVDGFFIKTDALETADHVDQHGVFHARYLVGDDVLFFLVGRLEHHFRHGFHHHQVVLFQDAVEGEQLGQLVGFAVLDTVEFGAVDGENHLVVNLIGIGIEAVRVVLAAVSHHAVDDAVGGVFTCVDNYFT